MLTKTLIASLLVVGTTATTALAAPPCETPAPVTYTAPRPIWHGPALPVFPTKIASDVHLGAHGYKTIEVGPQAGPFRKLILQNDAGRLDIKRVVVVFGNHQTESFREDQLLEGNATLTVDLANHKPRTIDKVVVYGSERAKWQTPGFTVVAA